MILTRGLRNPPRSETQDQRIGTCLKGKMDTRIAVDSLVQCSCTHYKKQHRRNHLDLSFCQSSDKQSYSRCVNNAAWTFLDQLQCFLSPQKPWSFAWCQIT